MVVSGKTKITGLFGHPVGHSLSPVMHNAAFDALNLDVCYVPFEVSARDLVDAVKGIRALNMLGVNVTVPHKERVIPLLDEIDKEASFIGAVNTIVNSEGKLKGYNTDGRGFMLSLAEQGVSVEGKAVLILGAGGASRAISFYVGEKASRLSLYDVDKPKAKKLVNDLKQIRNNVELADDVIHGASPHIIINATPLGLKPDDPMPINLRLITSEMVVCDLIYKNTEFLQESKKKGAKTLDGSGMLLWQGVLASELWTGIKPPVDVMRKALMAGIK